MTPRKKKKLEPDVPLTRAASLVGRLKHNQEDREVYCASDITKDWRYVDFWNPLQDMPTISMEWLFGGRGLLAGRIIRLLALYGVGKSAFMWLMYAAAQKRQQGWCYHIESEATPPPPDFIASFGCDPHDLVLERPRSLEHCFEKLDELMAQIRGGVAEKVMNPETGKMVKTKFDSPLDPTFESPIVAGVDSFSALGLDSRVMQDVLNQAKTAQVAAHSLKMSKYLQDRSDRYKQCQALLMLAAQQKSKIETGPGAGRGGTKKTSLGDTPIGFHSTYSVDLTGHKYIDKATGEDIGERITLRTTKNKLSPKHRELDIYLVRDHGFDLVKTDIDFLLSHSASPLRDVIKRQGGSNSGIKCPPVSETKVYKSDEEFLRDFYANEDLLQACREALRIRGMGFDFETKYMPTDSEIEDNEKSPKGASVLHGVEGSEKEISIEEDAG